MKVVVDTNVLISGIIRSHGAPASIVERWESGRFDLIITEWLRKELVRVLGYPRVIRTTKRPPFEVERIRTQLSGSDVGTANPAGHTRDPDDRNVLGAAVDFRADVIVSGDKDLLVLKEFAGIPILTPRQFLTDFDALAP